MFLSKHPYSFLFAGAGVILIIIILSIHTLSTPENTARATNVSGGTIEIPPTTNPLPPVTGTSITPVVATTNPPVTLTPKPTTKPPLHVSTSTNNTPTSTPSKTPTASPQNPSDPLLTLVYSMIPTGVAAPASSHPRTADQQALFTYGNEAGLAMMTFESTHTDMADVLKIWLADRGNPSDIASVNSLADALSATGASLESLPSVPESIAPSNNALADSLKDAGTKLRAIVPAGQANDLALVSAIRSYNSAADTFTQDYVAIATILSVSNVTFSSSDTGSAFQFPN